MPIKEIDNRQTMLGVVMPVYNGERFLKEAVYSVIKQSCKDLILVIVNDGSKDDSGKIAEALSEEDPRIRVIHQENSGVSAARNVGINYCIESNVKYIAFLDSDDVWVDDFYTLDLNEELKKGNKNAYRFNFAEANEELTRGNCRYIDNAVLNNGDVPVFGGHFCSWVYSSSMFNNFGLVFPVGIDMQEMLLFCMYF